MLVGVTLGDAGVVWLEDHEPQHVPAVKIAPVDTLAAGDVFHAAFTVALVEAMPVRAAAEFACAAAALKCERFGGRLGAPTRAEVEDALLARPKEQCAVAP